MVGVHIIYQQLNDTHTCHQHKCLLTSRIPVLQCSRRSAGHAWLGQWPHCSPQGMSAVRPGIACPDAPLAHPVSRRTVRGRGPHKNTHTCSVAHGCMAMRVGGSSCSSIRSTTETSQGCHMRWKAALRTFQTRGHGFGSLPVAHLLIH